MKSLFVRSNLVWIPILVQVIFLLPAINATRDILDVDSIAYSRIALYYLTARFDLAVCGYFGPLLSWIMLPFLWWSGNPVSASLWAMAVSAVVFQIGAILFFRAAGLRLWQTVAGGVMSGLFAVSWSVMAVVPDLLAAGLLLIGLSFVIGDRQSMRYSQIACASIFFAAASLAKAVMLPTAIASVASIYFVRWIVGTLGWRESLRRGGMVASLTIALLVPWFATVSYHYGKPTISTSAAINHAILRLKDEKRIHVFSRTFHKPDPGRITAWEDPSREAYEYWSPFDSMKNFQLQLGFIAGNFVTIVKGLYHLSALGAGLALSLAASLYVLWMLVFRRESRFLEEKRWMLAGPLIMVASAAYLPVFSDAQRYYLVAYPMMLALAFPSFQMVCRWLFSIADRGNAPDPRNSGSTGVQSVSSESAPFSIAAATLVLIFVFFSSPYVIYATTASQRPFVYKYNVTGREIAETLRDKATGPVASAGDIDHATVFAAFLSGRQYYGGRIDDPKLEEMLASGARFLVVTPGSKPDEALSGAAKVREIAARTDQPPDPRYSNYRIYQVLDAK